MGGAILAYNKSIPRIPHIPMAYIFPSTSHTIPLRSC